METQWRLEADPQPHMQWKRRRERPKPDQYLPQPTQDTTRNTAEQFLTGIRIRSSFRVINYFVSFAIALAMIETVTSQSRTARMTAVLLYATDIPNNASVTKIWR